MSWLFSQALVAAFLPENCSDGEPSALLSTTPTPQQSLSADKTTDRLTHSQYGATSEPLTAQCGEALLISYLAAFPVRRTHLPRRGATRQMTYGRKCGEWWQMSLPGTSLPRMSSAAPLTAQPTTLSRWATAFAASRYQRETWVLTTFGPDIGFLHTPTVTANFCAPSMQKHPCCQAWVTVFGEVSPSAFEWLMGWPERWTDLEPLETGKFQRWLQQHGDCSPVKSEATQA